MATLSIAISVTFFVALASATLEPYFIGGEFAPIAKYPHQLSLRVHGRHQCGASIISKHWAITTASCAHPKTAHATSLRAGSANLEKGGSIHDVAKIILHPRFNRSTHDNDVALLNLTAPFLFDANAKPIELAPANYVLHADTLARLSGWGLKSKVGSSYSKNLQELRVPIIRQNRCHALYWGNVTRNMFCAGYLNGSKAACGAEGSPLVVGDVLVGMVSWAQGCALRNTPTVYTRVSTLRDWVKSVAGV
ncbi:hypothetical protein KM043_014703 [Ampulex compressa]|nr:hypothetical protein KM043_014703 [Ampulex compressa]